MSPPIYTPDGSEVSEIVLPDGSTASEVIDPDGNVVFEAGPDIPDIGNLHHRYAASELSASVGNSINPWPDEAGSADLSGSGPTYQTGINSNPTVRYDAVDDTHQAPNKSAFNFLHDGTTAYSVYIVVVHNGGTDLAYPLTTEGVHGTGRRGVALFHDDRGGNNTLSFSVSNGSTIIAEINSNGDFPSNSPEVFSIHFDGTDTYELYRGKTSVGTSTSTNQSSSDSEHVLHRGHPLSSTGVEEALDGDVGEDLYYDVHHATATRESVIDYLANKYGVAV